jgi:hypothetical protein
MRYIQYAFSSAVFVLLFLFCSGNDGAFRVNGNQLIPIFETDISVKKEILVIRRISGMQAEVQVYYEFFNPGREKDIEVGFEAFSPEGDTKKSPKNGMHPYISGFKVLVNSISTPFNVVIVRDSLYYRNGKFRAISLAQALKDAESVDEVDFFYVYHFHAVFKQGLNIIQHSYIVDLSDAVEELYSLQYVLTAAKRWANRQIDDFTLQIDMGSFQDLSIENTFFTSASEWQSPQSCKTSQIVSDSDYHKPFTEFFIRSGMLEFKKTNFKPKGELNLISFSAVHYYSMENTEKISKKPGGKLAGIVLPFSIEDNYQVFDSLDEPSRRILKNLPFARRGYVFKTPDLKAYYEQQRWYFPEPTYTPALDKITRKEQEWLKKL